MRKRAEIQRGIQEPFVDPDSLCLVGVRDPPLQRAHQRLLVGLPERIAVQCERGLELGELVLLLRERRPHDRATDPHPLEVPPGDEAAARLALAQPLREGVPRAARAGQRFDPPCERLTHGQSAAAGDPPLALLEIHRVAR